MSRGTSPCVAFSILIDNSADGRLRAWINNDSQVGVIPKYSAISLTAPGGSVLKYSLSVIVSIVSKYTLTEN